jgi:hypothetical protein
MTAATQIAKKAGEDSDKARDLLQAAIAASGGARATTRGTKKAAPSDKPRRRTRGIQEVQAKLEELEDRLKEEKIREDGANQAVVSELVVMAKVLRWVAGQIEIL